MDIFIQRLEDLAHEKGVTMAKVLRDCNLGKNNMFKWKKIGSKPNKSTLKVLSDYFGVSPDYLSGEADEKAQTINITNSIYKSPNSRLNINNLSQQEVELINLYRGLSLTKQTALVSFINSLNEK